MYLPTFSLHSSRAFFVHMSRVAVFAAVLAAHTASAAEDTAEKIPFTAATVESNAGTFTIQWTATTDVKAVTIFTGPHPGEINRDTPVGKGETNGKITVKLPPGAARQYFELVPDHGPSLVTADRVLHLVTAPNFRDVGGYRAIDGRWVRMGMLYRSDQLNLLSDADLGILRALDIRMVCDLRTDDERDKGPDRIPANGAALVADVTGADANGALAGILTHPEKLRAMGPDKAAQAMSDVYRQLVSSPTAQGAYSIMFERLADPGLLPGVFHCTAGKDRTGWAAAVFLSIMGVPRETIMADYLASDALLTEKNKKLLDAMPDPAMRAAMLPLTGVRAAYLNAAFDQVTKSFGTIENYVTQGLHLSPPTLRLLRRIYTAG